MNSYYSKGDHGKIDYLYDNKGITKIAETIYFKDKKEFDKEIKDSIEIGRPITPIKYTELNILKEENKELKIENLLTRKAAEIYRNNMQEFWDIKVKENMLEPLKIISVKFDPNQYEEELER